MSSRSSGGHEGDGAGGGGVRFAGEESKDRLYERKQNKKIVRVLTVMAYVFSVSLAAIMLSLYYVFLWDPRSRVPTHQMHNATAAARSQQQPQQAPCSAPPLGPGGDTNPESQVPATPQLTLPIANDAMDAYGKRREARSTLMETTTQQMPLSTKWGEEGTPRGPNKQPLNQGSTPAPTPSPTQRIKAKAAERDTARHTTQHPHPAEVAVNA